MEKLHALFVDDKEMLREQYYENLRFPLRDSCGIELSHESVGRIEDAMEALPTGQSKFGLVVVDLLWPRVGGGKGREDSRGLEVVKQASKTPGVVIVAVSVGNTQNFPELNEDALESGAQVFRYRSSLQSASRSGGWERLALDITEELRKARSPSRPPDGAGSGKGRPGPHVAFVVRGRDLDRNASVNQFLRAIGLAPLEWEELVAHASDAGAGGNPHIFDIVRLGVQSAFGAIVVLTPDDEARLRHDLRADSDADVDFEPRGQARQNVLLEAGYALAHDRNRALIVTVGDVRMPSDLDGMQMVRLDDTIKSRVRFAEQLRAMGFAVNTQGTDWLEAGHFAP